MKRNIKMKTSSNNGMIELHCKNVLCINKKGYAVLLSKKDLSSDNLSSKYSWAEEFICNFCDSKFYICSICHEKHQSIKLMIKNQLYRHAKIHVNTEIVAKRKEKQLLNVNTKKPKFTNTPILKYDRTKNKQSIEEEGHNKEIPYVLDSLIKLKNVNENQSPVPYSLNSGITSVVITDDVSTDISTVTKASSLVAKANCGSDSATSYISKEDTMLHILLARMMSRITRYQRNDLCEIMNLIKRKYSSRNITSNTSTNDQIVLDIPVNDACIRQRYLTGKNSIMKNLPTPNVIVIKDHSYVSIKECLCNWLMIKETPDYIKEKDQKRKTIDCITQSKVAKQIYGRALQINKNETNEDVLSVLAIQWSDDFEPNTSIKSNRGSVWIKTITFISSDDNKNNINNTYPIAIGHKGKDHNDIE